jgi:hypothetical protein
MLKKLFNIIKNKFIITSLAFLTWIVVFDKNNLISQIELAKKLHRLKGDKTYYAEQIKQDETDTRELLTNPENLEKFAREKYLMKRDSEDIFLIIHNDSLPKILK